MTELDLRALVREAVARHLLGDAPVTAPSAAPPGPFRSPDAGHTAQAIYISLVNTTDDCVIEPSVRCNHCGYCKTHGY